MTKNEKNFLIFCDILIFTITLILIYIVLIRTDLLQPLENNSYLRDTNLISAAIASFFGALGGALIIKLSESRDNKKKDISALNRSLGVLLSIITTLVNVKRDYSDPQFQELDEIYFDYSWKRYQGERTGVPQIINIEPEHLLKEIALPKLPTEELIKNLNSYSLSGPNCFILATQLEQSLSRLIETIQSLNKRIQKIEKDPRPSETKLPICLGLETIDNFTDGYVESLIIVIDSEIKNALFFGRKLQALLEDIGSGKITSSGRMAKIKFLEEAIDHFPPEDHLENY